MTRWDVVAVLPLASVAVQMIVLVPGGSEAGALLVRLAMVQLSVAAGAVTVMLVAKHKPKAMFTLTFALVARKGVWVSSTMTRCEDVVVLPLASLAVQMTVLVPTANVVE